MREEFEQQATEKSVGERASTVPFDLRPRGLDQLVVLDARRAGGQTGHATQAGIEVTHERVAHGHLTLQSKPHEVDPAPGRVHLLAPEQIGRAGGKTETAMNAVIDELSRGRMVGIEDPATLVLRPEIGVPVPPHAVSVLHKQPRCNRTLHPVWLRCPSLKYSRYSHSSRVATRPVGESPNCASEETRVETLQERPDRRGACALERRAPQCPMLSTSLRPNSIRLPCATRSRWRRGPSAAVSHGS